MPRLATNIFAITITSLVLAPVLICVEGTGEQLTDDGTLLASGVQPPFRQSRQLDTARFDAECAAQSGPGHAFAWIRGEMFDIGTLGGPTSAAYDLNSRGQIVGASELKFGFNAVHAFLWERGVMRDLGTLGGDRSVAVGINQAGEIVGYSRIAEGPNRAFLWRDGRMIDLGTLGGSSSLARDINARGQIVGESATDTFPVETHAFLWEDGSMREIVNLGGGFTQATAINSRGQVVGWGRDPLFNTRAFIWQRGFTVDLGDLGGGESAAYGINDAGQVVGVSLTSSGGIHGFLWERGVLTDLGPVPGEDPSFPIAINSNGQILYGDPNLWVPDNPCSPDETRSFLSRNGDQVDLGTLGGSGTAAAALGRGDAVVGMSETLPGAPQSPPSHVWSAGFASESQDSGRAIATDDDGNSYVAGDYFRRVDFGGGPLQSTLEGVFLVKFDAEGRHVWSTNVPALEFLANALVLDSAETVYVAGRRRFGGGAAVVAHSAAGRFLYSTDLAPVGPDLRLTISDLAVRNGREILIAGEFRGSFTVGSTTITSTSDSDYDALLLAVRDGAYLWHRQYTATENNRTRTSIQEVAVDSDLAILIAGRFGGSIDLGGGSLTGGRFLAKLDGDGDHVWSRGFSSAGGIGDLAVDVSGDAADVLVGFDSRYSIDVGGARQRAVVAKFDAEGKYVWSQGSICTGRATTYDVSVDGFGNVLVAGLLYGSVDLGGGTVTSMGNDDVFVAKYDRHGQHLWSASFGDADREFVFSMTVDSAGSVHLTGRYGGTINFGGSDLPPSDEFGDIFVAKIGNPLPEFDTANEGAVGCTP